MKFPKQKSEDIGSYVDQYFSSVTLAAKGVQRSMIKKAADLLMAIYKAEKFVWVCGNGGSSAIANHLVCDHIKGIRSNTKLKTRVVSLVNNLETITAVSNDISYDEIFVFQLESLAQRGDLLITISSSGDSENVVKAFEWARNTGLYTITFTGFSGGRTQKHADANIHVDAENYGVVEDVHQCLMHILAQFIRMRELSADEVGKLLF